MGGKERFKQVHICIRYTSPNSNFQLHTLYAEWNAALSSGTISVSSAGCTMQIYISSPRYVTHASCTRSLYCSNVQFASRRGVGA